MPNLPKDRVVLVERRIRLDNDLAVRLDIASKMRGQTISEFIAWALVPHLHYDLPKLPEVPTGSLRPAKKASA